MPAVASLSAGHVAELPLQTSSRSHAPTPARHTIPAFPAGCWHDPDEPSHWSRVQGFPSLVHAVATGSFAFAGQVVELPVQVSAGSHSPVDGLQTTVFGAGPHVPRFPGTLHAWQSVGLLPPHAVPQQTLSSQMPDLHSLVPLHVEPGSFLFAQAPPLQ